MKNLKKLRRDASMTQYRLSAVTGIARWRVSHAELGILTLTPSEVESIRKVLADAIQKKSRSLAELSA
jgi:hypothetical protein